MGNNQICKICGSESQLLFTGKILNKYNISYFNCKQCGFIQTENPYWLEESYHSAIADLDIGYLSRNLIYKDFVSAFITGNKQFNSDAAFLDYGGGYGAFVRLMRDKGFDFYRDDRYCENIFAKYFDMKDITVNQPFEMITCFEVFEHLVDPLSEIEKMLSYSKSIFFSTELQPCTELKSSGDWWYFSPESGQHISFYTKKSLEIIAEKYHLNLYTDGISTHLFTDKVLEQKKIKKIFNKKPTLKSKIYTYFLRKIKKKKLERESYLQKDFQYVKCLINSLCENII
jgi:2-polyprenyl-3-methyl-5-hydroxy-6-metoxy-1,4-benzoquinol methylase